jgi:hypothetical protein
MIFQRLDDLMKAIDLGVICVRKAMNVDWLFAWVFFLDNSARKRAFLIILYNILQPSADQKHRTLQ